MYLNEFGALRELVTIGIGALLLICSRRRDAGFILAAMSLYGSIYFIPSIIPMLTGKGMEEITAVHFRGSGKALKIFTLCLFLMMAYFSMRQGKNWLRKSSFFLYFVPILFLISGFVSNRSVATGLDIQNTASLVMMFGFLFLLSETVDCDSKTLTKPAVIYLALLLLFVANSAAFYELLYQKAWARFLNSSDELVMRASSFLFNPNLYGIWCACFGLMLAYCYHSKKFSRLNSYLLFGIALSGVGLFLSSSRSATYLLYIALVASAILIPKEHTVRRIAPILTVFVIMTICSILPSVFNRSVEVKAFSVLGERLYRAPVELASFIEARAHVKLSPIAKVFALGKSMASGAPLVGEWPIDADNPPDATTSEFMTAFDGRFNGEGRDSGLLTVYDDSGLLGLLGFLGFFAMLFIVSCKAHLIRKSVETAYAITVLSFCVAIGVFMRYQVFPIWLFIVILLSPCIALWNRIIPVKFDGYLLGKSPENKRN